MDIIMLVVLIILTIFSYLAIIKDKENTIIRLEADNKLFRDKYLTHQLRSES